MGAARTFDRIIPDANLAPVIVGGHIDRGDIALDLSAPPVDLGPIGVGEQHFARIDHLADIGNMAKAHVAMRLEHHHRALLGTATAGIFTLGLIPPGARITINLDA